MSGQVFKNEFSLDKGECVYYLLSLSDVIYSRCFYSFRFLDGLLTQYI